MSERPVHVRSSHEEGLKLPRRRSRTPRPTGTTRTGQARLALRPGPPGAPHRLPVRPLSTQRSFCLCVSTSALLLLISLLSDGSPVSARIPWESPSKYLQVSDKYVGNVNPNGTQQSWVPETAVSGLFSPAKLRRGGRKRDCK